MSSTLSNQMKQAEILLEETFPDLTLCDEASIQTVEAEAKLMFANNVSFLRSYLGFYRQSRQFTQQEYADKLRVSVGTLKQWETGVVLPNKLSLDSIVNHCNEILERENLLHEKLLLCRNLVHLLPKLISLNDGKCECVIHGRRRKRK